MNSERIPEWKQEKLFAEVLTRKGNNECSDCLAKSPAWVSLDFRAVICMNCAGAHRSLGPSVTRVRSMKLDAWYEEYYTIIEELSNIKANSLYEGKKPQWFSRPSQLAPLDERKRFVIEKYIKKSFINPDYERNSGENEKPDQDEFGEFVIEEFQVNQNHTTNSRRVSVNLLDDGDEIVKVIEPNAYIPPSQFDDFGPFEGSHHISTEKNDEWNDFQDAKRENQVQGSSNFNIMSLYANTHVPQNTTVPLSNNIVIQNPVQKPTSTHKKDPEFISALDFLGEPVKIQHKSGYLY